MSNKICVLKNPRIRCGVIKEYMLDRFYYKVDQIMKDRGISSNELAHRMQANVCDVVQLLIGVRETTLLDVASIADALGYDVHFVIIKREQHVQLTGNA